MDPDDLGPSVWVYAGLYLGSVSGQMDLSQRTWLPIP